MASIQKGPVTMTVDTFDKIVRGTLEVKSSMNIELRERAMVLSRNINPAILSKDWKPERFWCGKVTDCDICEEQITNMFADAAVCVQHRRAWGILCPGCIERYQVRFGTGAGQLYILEEGKWIKVAG